MSNIFGNHGFSQAIVAAEEEVAALSEEVQSEGTFDQGAIDFLGPMPFEVGHWFEAAQPSLGEAALEAAAGQIGDFRASDFFQQLARAPALGRGSCQEII